MTVDAYVSDKQGKPVADLKLERTLRPSSAGDNKPQTIGEQFRLIQVDGNPKAGEPPASPIRDRDDEVREAARDDDAGVRRSFSTITTCGFDSSLAVPQAVDQQFIQNEMRPNST